MDHAAREIQHVSRLENGIEDAFSQVGLLKVLAGESRKDLVGRSRVVEAPALAAFELEDEGLDVVVVRSKALGARRSQVNVGADEAAEEFLESGEHLPTARGVALRVQQSNGTALLIVIPNHRREGSPLW